MRRRYTTGRIGRTTLAELAQRPETDRSRWNTLAHAYNDSFRRVVRAYEAVRDMHQRNTEEQSR